MIFPLRWTGGFQRTRRCEEDLDVEMTSWGTVGAMIVKRVMLRGGAPSEHCVIYPPFPEGSMTFPALLPYISFRPFSVSENSMDGT